MRLFPLTPILFVLACGPVDIGSGDDTDGACDPCGDDTGNGDDDGGTNPDPDDDDGDDDEPAPQGDLVLYVGTPGGIQVGTLFINAEPLTDLDAEFGDWSVGPLRYAWSYGQTVNMNPGPIEGIRYNVTYCTDEVDSESDASCNSWLAYGQDESESHLTAPTSVQYLGQSYSVDTVVVCWDSYCGSSAISEFVD